MIDTAVAAVQSTSRTVYDARWRKYVDWCAESDLDPVKAPLTKVMNFFQSLVTEGKKLNTIKGYVTAVSKRHKKVKIGSRWYRLSKTSIVRTWLRGLSVHLPTAHTVVPEWSLEIVLSALKKPPFYAKNLQDLSLKHLTLRTVFLLALTSARRASEIHALDFSRTCWNPNGVSLVTRDNFVPKCNTVWHRTRPIVLPATFDHQDPELRKLCVRTTLRAYVNRTKVLRSAYGADQLLLCYGGSRKGKPVSKQRISTWLKDVVRLAYKAKQLPPPGKVKGHDVRKMATSWADVAGVDPLQICEAATWRSENMFARFYRLDLIHKSRTELGRRVLSLAASSSAEQALQSSLGQVSTTPSKRSKHSKPGK